MDYTKQDTLLRCNAEEQRLPGNVCIFVSCSFWGFGIKCQEAVQPRRTGAVPVFGHDPTQRCTEDFCMREPRAISRLEKPIDEATIRHG